MRMRITLISLMNYQATEDEPYKLFDKLTVPENTLDRETLIDTILLRGGEYEVLYPNPDFLAEMMGRWSKKYENTIKRWFDAFHKEYDPIDNYNRYEEWSETREGETDEGTEGSSTVEYDGDNTRTDDLTDTQKVSAYNSSTYKDSEQGTNTGTVHDVTDDNTRSEYQNTLDRNYKDETSHEGHLHGNIGVTTTQAMIREEFNLYLINLYDDVADLFLHDFVIPVT